MTRKILLALLIFGLFYLGIGITFHLKWKSELAVCREIREAQGEFVEPEVFGGILGLVFDMTNWPVYAWANIYHDGTLFATPCTHSNKVSVSDEEGAVRYVVESFGERLQNVSLQAPNVAEMIKEQYAEWVTPELLEIWEERISRAPGRVVSSPWPDRIEIVSITQESATRYAVIGF